MTQTAPRIQHDADGHRFSTSVEGHDAHLDYDLEGDTMTITRTWVPDPIGGRGIAGELVEAAFEHARTNGLKVRPVCSYAAGWANRTSRYNQLLV